ncbi:hypothetical protein OC861_004629 [Tilletia horrida]|nr:hypothetical protein OC845_004649 [Tilletia horrida]KAK0563783.1 hypothetical protein OC861_004629 [Tilletia horrida]
MAIDKKVPFAQEQEQPQTANNLPASSSSHPAVSSSTTNPHSYSGSSSNNMGNPHADYQSINRGDDESQPGLPPPSYAQSQPAGPWDAQASYDQYRRKRKWRRAVHWTIAAVLILLLWRTVSSWFSSESSTGPYPPSSDGSPSDWAHWSSPIQIPRKEWPSSNNGPYYSTQTKFTLDPAASTLFLSAQGSYYDGSATYEVVESSAKDVEVNVEVVYASEYQRNRLTVAKMEDSKRGRQGVGIYSEDHKWQINYGQIRVNVRYALPKRSGGYKRLEADVHNLGIHVADLGTAVVPTNLAFRSHNGAVEFKGDLRATEHVELHSQNGHVSVGGELITPVLDVDSENGAVDLKSVYATTVDAHSQNGRVHGFYNVSRKLTLQSDNGAIEASVAIRKADDGKKQDDDDQRKNEVVVDARSSNGHVDIRYVSQPKDVILTSSVQSENGHAAVRHNETKNFAGLVDLETMMGSLRVHIDSVKGRVWKVFEEKHGIVHRELHGKMYFDDQPDFVGSSSVRSSNGGVEIYL